MEICQKPLELSARTIIKAHAHDKRIPCAQLSTGDPQTIGQPGGRAAERARQALDGPQLQLGALAAL